MGKIIGAKKPFELFKLVEKIIPKKHLDYSSNGGCVLRFEHSIINLDASDPYNILSQIIELSGASSNINSLYQEYIQKFVDPISPS